jgi:hypothetical protein
MGEHLSVKRMLGYDEEELRGRAPFSFILPEDEAEGREAL